MCIRDGYKAEDWANYFGSLVGNGYRASSLTALQVIPGGDGLSVIVRAGKGFINGYFYDNTEDMTIYLPTADGVLARIDRVVLRLSYVERMMYVAIKSSAPSSSPVAPEMQRDADAWELTLADVLVSAGATGVLMTNITDRRNDKNYCGPVVALIDQIDTEEFGQQIVDTLEGVQSEAAEILAEIEAELAAVKDTSAFLMRSGGTMTGDLIIDRAKLQLTIPGTSGAQHYWHVDMDSTGGTYIGTGESGYDNNFIHMTWRETLFARPIAFEGGATGDIAKQTRENLGVSVAEKVTEAEANAVSGAAVAAYALNKSTVTKETWTFTLEDGSTVDKVVLLG